MENTSATSIMQQFLQSFTQKATNTVFGEPIVAQGKTIITVAKVSHGFGGGFGVKAPASETSSSSEKPTKAAKAGEGGGFGGGLQVKPVGFIEITERQTRFVRISTTRYLLLGAVAGIVLKSFFSPKAPKQNREITEKKKKKKK